MYDVDENLKTIYRNDMFPRSETIAPKEIELYFEDLNLTVDTEQFAVDKGDFELHESICMEDQIKFGKCNSSSVKFTLADVTDDIKGKEFSITQTVIVDEEISYPMPFGYFTVNAAKKQDDLRFKDIVAYDRMKKIDVDVSDWYNSLTFPMSLATFRASFLTHIGLVEDTSKLPLPNDSMSVEKTIEPSQLSGRTVIEACQEINGCFGLIGRDGKFSHIILKTMHHDYPQNDFPESDFPEGEPYDEYVNSYQEIHFEEYRVQPIDKIQIRQEENDIGAIYGTGTNVYIIQGNFLVYGKSAVDLQTIAQNVSANIFDRGYRPYTSVLNGLPYVMPGDFIKYDADDTTAGYVFERTLTGIQALRDEYGAQGSEVQEQSFGVNEEIIQLKGRTAILKKTVEEVSASVTALDLQLTGEINILAGQVVLKVNSNGNIGYIDLLGDPDTDLTSINIKADDISLEGLVTVNGNLKVLTDGTLEAVNGKFSGQVTASAISGSTFTQTGSSGTVTIANGLVTADAATILGLAVTQSLNVGSNIILNASNGAATVTTLNGTNINGSYGDFLRIYVATIGNAISSGTPIHSGNISSQSVNYAETSYTANSAVYANYAGSISGALYTNQITASNTGYGNIDLQGFDNAAGVNWVQANFAPIGASDFRLKHNILPMDNIPDELFYELKPYQFNYKTTTYGEGIFFGLIAQEVESAFKRYNLNPYEYDLIDVKDVREYTDDGFYVKDETHRIHYNNFIGWLIKISQMHNNRILQLENIINSL